MLHSLKNVITIERLKQYKNAQTNEDENTEHSEHILSR